MRKLFLVLGLIIALTSLGNADILELGFEDCVGASFYDFKTDDILAGGYLNVFDFCDFLYGNLGFVFDGVFTVPTLGLSLNLKTGIEKMGGTFHLREGVQIGSFFGRDFARGINYAGVFVGIVVKLE